ncbi:MAG: hypothetical protein K0S33_4040 [Bacteroidetes bacterium]|jgi:hypothetical protein|nr:hypothetical protein [Bacteroidota bacterium]
MQNNDLFKRVYWYLGAFMSLLIFIFGIALLATQVLYETIPPPNRTWIAIIFLVYSVIRGARVIQQYKQFKSRGDE